MTLFVVFLFLAIYNTGCMTTLQLQHYGIYPAIGMEGFAERRLQGEMAATGYDETKVRALIRTNWVRTISYLLLAVLCISILLRVPPSGA